MFPFHSIRRCSSGVPPEYHLTSDADYKLETLHLMLSSFKTKMRADFDATFHNVDRKTRILRKEMVQHVMEALEVSETHNGFRWIHVACNVLRHVMSCNKVNMMMSMT